MGHIDTVYVFGKINRAFVTISSLHAVLTRVNLIVDLSHINLAKSDLRLVDEL